LVTFAAVPSDCCLEQWLLHVPHDRMPAELVERRDVAALIGYASDVLVV
jgi:hypothetical protein